MIFPLNLIVLMRMRLVLENKSMTYDTLREHDKTLEKHDDNICAIRQDLVDIKTRLGIKDITNGNVLKYQQNMVKAQELERKERKEAFEQERLERKESDAQLMNRIDKIDGRIWFLVVGVCFVAFVDILKFAIQSHFGG